MIWSIVLAAGESKRMREPKLLLPYGKMTVIETVIKSILRSKIKNILVIVGSNKEKMEEKIKKLPVKIAVNPNFKEGMLSSIQKGFKSLPSKAQAAVVCLGDQPSVPSDVIDKIVNTYKETGKGIIVPVYKGRRGHPVLIDLRYRAEVKNLTPDVGLRALLSEHSDDIQEIEVNTPNILKDIDTPDEYKRELS